MTAFQSKLKKLNIVSQHSTKRGMAIFSLIIIFSMLLAMPAQVGAICAAARCAAGGCPAGAAGDHRYLYRDELHFGYDTQMAQLDNLAAPSGQRRATSWSTSTTPSTI